MKKILKQFYKISIVILLVITVLVISGLVLGRVYKDEIRNYVISGINQQLDVKVNVRSADFSVFRKFPFISIILNDAVIFSSNEFGKSEFTGISTDTLFSASRIYLQFNLIDILEKNYRLRKVHAVDGKLNLLVDREGKGNYRIIKNDGQGNKESDITIGLDGVKISGFYCQFHNLAKKIHSVGRINDVALKGKFTQNRFSLNSIASFYIESFNREGIEYVSKLKIGSRVILDVHDSVYTITKGELALNNLNFRTGGSFTSGSKIILDLQVAGEKLDIKTLLNILPIDNSIISKYSPSGTGEILAKVKGELSSLDVPSIRSAFKITNGKIFLADRGSPVNGIELRGTYSNGTRHNATTSRLNITEYKVKYGNNDLSGAVSLDNLIAPFISASLTGTILASDLSDILNIDGLKLKQGTLFPNLSFNMSLDSLSSFNLGNISAKGMNGKLDFKQVSGMTPFSDMSLDLLDGTIKIEGESWFPDFKITLGKNSLSAKLTVNYFWGYFVSNSEIPEIKGEVKAEYLSFTDFIKDTGPDEDYEFHLPDSIFLNLHCTVDSFKYGKFLASDVETWFNYKPGFLSVSSLTMQSMNGNISAGGAVISDNQGQMLLRASGFLHKIDIYKLFYSFNNFGQDFIIAENLKGSVTGSIEYSGYISPKLELVTKNLTAQSDFTIEDGELINFEPITELSSFVELSELQHIRFSTLKNSILVKDEKVYIPQMDINSSAFNLTISGTHGFDNYFEYKLKLSLSEILARKAKKAKKENEEFGSVEEDGSGNTNLYLSIKGTPEDFKIKYDKKEAINQIKTDLKEEKKLLKTILNEELGLFKKDSTEVMKKHKSDQKGFKMVWGDEPETVPQPNNEKNKTKKDSAFKITWEEDDPPEK